MSFLKVNADKFSPGKCPFLCYSYHTNAKGERQQKSRKPWIPLRESFVCGLFPVKLLTGIGPGYLTLINLVNTPFSSFAGKSLDKIYYTVIRILCKSKNSYRIPSSDFHIFCPFVISPSGFADISTWRWYPLTAAVKSGPAV